MIPFLLEGQRYFEHVFIFDRFDVIISSFFSKNFWTHHERISRNLECQHRIQDVNQFNRRKKPPLEITGLATVGIGRIVGINF
jgi:hypothetical protein